MKADLHVHTNASVDSEIRMEDVIKYAGEAGIGCVAITDHDTIRNAKKLEEMSKGTLLRVIVGSEITTDKMTHVIGLFLKKEIRSKDIFSVIREIKAQGGLVVLPHPFRRDSGLVYNYRAKNAYSLEDVRKIISLCDVVEIGNGNSRADEMVKAKGFFKSYKIPYCAGSDAHYPVEIGTGYTVLSDCGTAGELKRALLKRNEYGVTYKAYPKDVSFALLFMQKAAHIFKKMDGLYIFGTRKILVSIYGKIYNAFRRRGAKKAKREKIRV